MTPEEWRNLSLDGRVCGMFGCDEKPTSKCTICNCFYCYEDIRDHFHVLAEK